MSEQKNQKIEAYYNHDEAYPHQQKTEVTQQKVVTSTETTSPSTVIKEQTIKLSEVISPVYGKKIDVANDVKSTMGYEKEKTGIINLATASINEIIEQKISEKKAEVINAKYNEESEILEVEEEIEAYYKKYDPLLDESTIKSTLAKRNKLSEQAAQTESFLFKPRKNGENIFGARTEELTLELEQIKEKIRNTNPRQNINDIYGQTTMFEGIEEQKEINKQIRQAIAGAYQINDNFSENMSLDERRRLIQKNSIQAGATRYKTLKNLQDNNLNNQFLRRPKAVNQGSSEYHKMLHELRKQGADSPSKQVSEYYANRNPYMARMLEIEEKNAKEAEKNRKMRIKEQIESMKNDNKNNK